MVYTLSDANEVSPIGNQSFVLVNETKETRNIILTDPQGRFAIDDANSSDDYYLLYAPSNEHRLTQIEIIKNGTVTYKGKTYPAFYISSAVLSRIKLLNQASSESAAAEDSAQPVLSAIADDIYFSGSLATLTMVLPNRAEPISVPVTVFQWQAAMPQSPIYGFDTNHYVATMGGTYLGQGGFSLTMEHALRFFTLTRDIFENPIPAQLVLTLHTDFNNPNQPSAGYIFEGVRFTAVSHIVTPSGEPVGENYEFMFHMMNSNNKNFPTK
jgi:hypothetical protein